MDPRRSKEKIWKEKRHSNSGRSGAKVVIIACQHALLWCACAVMVGAVWILVVSKLETEELVSEVLLLAAVRVTHSLIQRYQADVLQASLSLLYLALRMAAAFQLSKTSVPERLQRMQKITKHCLRLSVTTWLVTCGITITFTTARHPACSSMRAAASPLNSGRTCIVQRTVIAVALAAM